MRQKKPKPSKPVYGRDWHHPISEQIKSDVLAGRPISINDAVFVLKAQGWELKRGRYFPPVGKPGIPLTGLSFSDACSFAGISLISPKV